MGLSSKPQTRKLNVKKIMIVSLTGQVRQKGPLWAVIEVQGIGYCVHMPVGTLEQLPALDGTTQLHTHVVYREDAQTLFGFHKRQERDFFQILVEKVSGVGPKLALALLSTFSSEALEQALDNEDTTMLSRCPGIGKKTAERLILELRDKRPKAFVSNSSDLSDMQPSLPPAADQALSGLMSLGYSLKEAQKALQNALKSAPEEASTEWLLKQALKA